MSPLTWRQIIDTLVVRRLEGRPLEFGDRATLAASAAHISEALPLSRGLRELCTKVVEHDLGIVDGLEIPAATVEGLDLFAVGRATLLGHGTRSSIEQITMVTCVRLHAGERLQAADGLVAIGSLRSAPALPDVVSRFVRQAMAHLDALHGIFPDQAADQSLSIAKTVFASAC